MESFPICRGCDEVELCTSSASCKYHGLDFVRTAQTAISLRSERAANDDWWYKSTSMPDDKIVLSADEALEYIEQFVRDNADLFPPDFLKDH